MENKSHALAAGTFVLVVAALLAGVAYWLTRDNAQYRLFELSSKESVSGLQPQAAVRYKGVSVGKVTRIGFDPDTPGNVLIRIAVNDDAPISNTTFAVLGYQGVTGLAHILLDDDDAPLPQPAPGESGLPRLPLQTSPFGRLAEQGPAILSKVDEAASRINQLLGDDNQRLMTAALGNIGLAAGRIDTLTQRIDSLVHHRLDPALAAVPPLASDARQAMQSLQQAGASVGAAAQGLGQTAQRLNAEGGTMDQIAEGTRAIGHAADQFAGSTLPRLNRATEETARAARQLGRAAGSIGDNPQSIIYGPGRTLPGPGEPGFTPPQVVPR